MTKIRAHNLHLLESGTAILLMLYIFFPFKLINGNKMILLGSASALLICQSIKYNVFRKIDLKKYIWIVLLYLFLVFNTLRFNWNENATKELIIFAFGILLLVISSVDYYLYKTILKWYYFFSFIGLISIILQILFPNTILKIIESFMDTDAYTSASLAYRINGYYVGFLCNSSLSAFFSSFIAGVEFAKLLQFSANKYGNRRFFNKANISSIILILVSIAAIMASGKRGVLFSTILAIGATMMFIPLKNKKSHKKIIVWAALLIVLIIAYCLLNNLPSLKYIYNRIFNNSDNFFSDRVDLYYIPLLKCMKSNMFLGHGVASTGEIISSGSAHNIYIQVLYENGIVGIILYGAFFASSFIYIIKKIRNNPYQEVSYEYMLSMYIQLLFLIYGLSGNPLYVSGLLITYLFIMSPGYRPYQYSV